MRLRVILSEAWRNVSADLSRTMYLMLSTTTVCAILGLATLAVSWGFIDQGREFQESGAATLIVTAEDAVDGMACDALSTSSAVHASGALRSTTALRTAAAPDFEIPTFEISAGFAPLLGVTSNTVGALISRQLADQLSIRVGDNLVLSQSATLPVAAVYDFPEDGRLSTLAFAVLLPHPVAQAYDECWTRIWPTTAENRDLGLLSVGTTGEVGPKLTQLNSSRGIDFNGGESFAHRITLWSPLVCLAVISAIFFSATRLRIVVIASDLHAGMQKMDAMAVQLVEGATLIVPALFVGAVIATAAQQWSGWTDGNALAQEQLFLIGASGVGMMTGVIIGVLTVRRTRLFEYFKNR